MMSRPFIFSLELASAPFDDAELGLYQTLIQEHLGDYFHIKVRVKNQRCFTHQPQQPQQTPIIITPPLDWFSSEGSMLLTTQDFLENGPSYMQLYFPSSIIPSELIHAIMPDVTTYANATVRDCRSGSHYEGPNFRLFKLVLDIVIVNLYEEEHDDDDDDIITSMVMRESMEHIKMVPASKTAIESLKKVKLENRDTVERCSICLTEFDGDAEVSSMPCKHVYHKQCLIQWLKTSHLCPLCRYAMPT